MSSIRFQSQTSNGFLLSVKKHRTKANCTAGVPSLQLAINEQLKWLRNYNTKIMKVKRNDLIFYDFKMSKFYKDHSTDFYAKT